jgi:hypothetical protein
MARASSFLEALGDVSISNADLERLAIEESPFAVNPHSLDLLEAALEKLNSPIPPSMGRPLCGAVGKIKAVDRALADEAQAGGTRSVNPLLLEADWLATRTALFYVTPRLESVIWWKWDVITGMRAGRERWKFSGVSIDKADGGTLELRTSREAAKLLIALGRRFVAGPHRPT